MTNAKTSQGPCAAEAAPALLEHGHGLRNRQSMTMRFSIKLSTEQNNETNDKTFYGPYQHLKKQMDYSYHR
jgi:hypothetical protein